MRGYKGFAATAVAQTSPGLYADSLTMRGIYRNIVVNSDTSPFFSLK